MVATKNSEKNSSTFPSQNHNFSLTKIWTNSANARTSLIELQIYSHLKKNYNLFHGLENNFCINESQKLVYYIVYYIWFISY